MTRLSSRKSNLKFQTEACVREQGRIREVIIETDLGGRVAYVRLAGLRTKFQFSWDAVYSMAVKASVEAARREKKAGKK